MSLTWKSQLLCQNWYFSNDVNSSKFDTPYQYYYLLLVELWPYLVQLWTDVDVMFKSIRKQARSTFQHAATRIIVKIFSHISHSCLYVFSVTHTPRDNPIWKDHPTRLSNEITVRINYRTMFHCKENVNFIQSIFSLETNDKDVIHRN